MLNKSAKTLGIFTVLRSVVIMLSGVLSLIAFARFEILVRPLASYESMDSMVPTPLPVPRGIHAGAGGGLGVPGRPRKEG